VTNEVFLNLTATEYYIRNGGLRFLLLSICDVILWSDCMECCYKKYEMFDITTL